MCYYLLSLNYGVEHRDAALRTLDMGRPVAHIGVLWANSYNASKPVPLILPDITMQLPSGLATA